MNPLGRASAAVAAQSSTGMMAELAYSVVIPVHNEEANVRPLIERVALVMAAQKKPFEILIVDDGSTDRTLDALRALSLEHPELRVVSFARNYGQEAAVEALYLNARGRLLIQMDGDLQHPPEEIPKLLAKVDEGFDVVYGLREKRQDTLFRSAGSRTMQRSMRWLDIELPEDISTFRAMSAPIARLVAALPERRKFFSALLVWCGAKIGTVPITHAPRQAGRTKYNLTKLANHTFDLVVGFSSKPLRVIGLLGLGFALAGFALGAWTIGRKVLFGYGVTGWPSLFAAVVVLSGTQLCALSVIGEYIARIYIQVQGRPLYHVRERINDNAFAGLSAVSGAFAPAAVPPLPQPLSPDLGGEGSSTAAPSLAMGTLAGDAS